MAASRIHVVVVVALGFVWGCGDGGDARTSASSSETLNPTSGTTNPTSSTTSLDSAGELDLPTQPEIVSIQIEPMDPVIVVQDGVIPPPTQFTAIGTTSEGEEVPVSGSWSFDRFDLGVIDQASGELTATGLLGGVGTVTVEDGDLSATTSATIKLHITYDPDGVDPMTKMAFDEATDPDPLMQLLYPYDQTVFPRGLEGPTLQWNGGAAADIYYVHAHNDTFEFEGWGSVPPPSRYEFPSLPIDVWLKLTDSTDDSIQIDVQRYDGAQAYLPETQNWTIAAANLTGTIYYWEVNTGNVVRIEPGDTAPENFIQKPAGVDCVACHSVSRDGSRIVASFHGGYSPWGTFEAETGASLFASDSASGFQAISPDGEYVVWRHWSDAGFASLGSLVLSTFDSTAELALLMPPAGGAPSHPAWSPDGQKIAFSVRTDGNGLDFTQSTLWVTDVDLVTPQFTGYQEIATNDPQRPTVTYPSFAPDSEWIAFQRATQARSRGAQGELWLTNLDGSVELQLHAANGVGAIDPAQQSTNFEPTMMPVAVGGYFWVVFVSERMYGNILTDTNPTTRFKQLWVAAIDASPQAGQDPSHPAFWLPGQELNNQNMRGSWALSPCKELGETCEAGFECCEGFCHEDENGQPVCSEQPEGCSLTGDACDTADDCCDPGESCIGGFCGKDIP